MVDAAPRPPLTKLSFRRDVRLFLTVLVGFLVVLIILLLLLLESFLGHTHDVIWNNWRTVADIAARTVDDPANSRDVASTEARLALLQSRYGIAGLRLTRADGRVIESGVPPAQAGVEQITKNLTDGTLVLVFDSSRLTTIRRTFWLTAVICLIAAGIGTLLLVLYIPRITQPIEAMLESAATLGARAPHVGEQEYLIETFRNSISLLKQQEADLQRLHDLQKTRADDLARVTAALTRSITSGFVAVDPQSRIVDVNAAAREILRPSSADVAGLPLEQAFGDNAFTNAVAGAVLDRVSLARAELAVDVAGARRVIGLTTVPLADDEGQFLGLLALFTDLTPFRQLESRVREMQNLADLGEISAGIAHEFRNALGTILGYLRLARRAQLPADALKAIEHAETEASLLSGAVDRLLAFARPMTLERQPVALLELLQEVAERAGDQARGVTIETRGEPVTLHGDHALLTRLFDNLVRNAVDSVHQTGREGRVTIEVGAAPHPPASGASHGIYIRITDDGVGVDPADVPRLFLPFQSDKPGGYGLGLPLAKKIALLHGGTLTLDGERGKGAEVVVAFTDDVAAAAGTDTFRNTGNALAGDPVRAVRV